MADSLFPVLPSEELPAGKPNEPGIRRVRAGRVEVLLARLENGEVVAFDTICPHESTNLEDATFWDGKLRCPRHLYLYDTRSGENLLPAREARPENLWKLRPGYLPVHRVEERDGWIWVDEAPQGPPPGYDPSREKRPPGARRAAPEELAERPAAPPPPAGPVEHPRKTLRVREGAVFELRLPTSPRPGHTWKVEVDGSLLAVVEQAFHSGDQPRYSVHIAAHAAGQAEIRCAYGRPWDPVPAEVRRYVVLIDPTTAP